MTKNIHLFFISFYILFFGYAYPQEEKLRINFIDVGEGDAILLGLPCDENVLIDCGGLASGHKLIDFLEKRRIKKITSLIITHPHLDHIGGVFFLNAKINIGAFSDNAQPLGEGGLCSDIYRWYADILRRRDNYRRLKRGDVISSCGVTLKVLWPAQPPLPGTDYNDNSIVMMADYAGIRCLLCADITENIEKRLLEWGDIKADILKVSHHGAADATSGEFLDKVSPEIAVISVDRNNKYGYPSEAVLNRIKRSGARIYRTDLSGNIMIEISKDGIMAVAEEAKYKG